MKFFKKKILYRDKNFIQLGKEIICKVPYLIRYTLFTCKYFSIKIHKILISDPSDMHDHPWDYISIILWGGYYEETLITEKEHIYHRENSSIINSVERLNNTFHYKKWYKPGSILIRKGDAPHRLIIPEGKFAISLIFTSYKYRLWGYHKTN